MAAEPLNPWHLSRDRLKRLGRRIQCAIDEHQVLLVSGALAYSAMLAIFPALVAAVSIYGLISSPQTVTQQVAALVRVIPASARDVVLGFLQSIVGTSSGGLSVALVLGVLAALFSASSGMSTLIDAVEIAYEERHARSFWRQRALAFGLTFVAVVFFIVALFGIAVLPAVSAHLGSGAGTAVSVGRWFVLAGLAWLVLSGLYRVVPCRDKPSLKVLSLGSTLATLLWIGASLLFALFVANFGHFGATYGSLASVIVLLTWFYISSFVILLGAEVSAESETAVRAQGRAESRA
jgi:membrane protein